MKAALVVLDKELRDGVRDRRSLLALLLFPLIGPLVLSLSFTKVVEQASPSQARALPVIGREHAPGLVSFLEQQGLEIAEGPADPIAAVRDRRADMVLIIPADYGARYRSLRTASVELVMDESRHDTLATARRVEHLIRAHSRALGSLRLMARGVSPSVGQPVELRTVDLSTPKKRAAIFLNMLPMFAFLASFVGGMQLAADATAGERERGSLEPLLITPAPRRSLLLGKWLAAAAFSMLALATTSATTLLALSTVPADRLGLTLELSAAEAALAMLTALPLAFFFPAAQLLLASFARTVREAQTYMSLAIFLPMLPAFLTSFDVLVGEGWMVAVPVLGQQVLLTDIVGGEPVEPLAIVAAALVTLALALACVRAAAWLLRRERVVFGR